MGLEVGRIPFYEPDLAELVARGLDGGRLSFADSDGLASTLGEADVAFKPWARLKGRTDRRTYPTSGRSPEA